MVVFCFFNFFSFFTMGKSACDPHIYVWERVKGGYPYYEGPYDRGDVEYFLKYFEGGRTSWVKSFQSRGHQRWRLADMRTQASKFELFFG